jgi:chromate transporter
MVGGGHGASGKAVDDRETILGLEGAADPRPTAAWSWRVGGVILGLWLAPVAALGLALGPAHVFTEIAVFFSQMAVLTFGGAYAVLAWVAQAAVETHGWLQPGEMLDGLGMAETTPGPLIMVTQFVGFMGAFRDPGSLSPLTAGVLGGLLTTWVTFAPCFLWIFLGAPHVERLRGDRALSAALATITAAVVGVILNLAVWFALHVVFREVGRIGAGPLDMVWPVLGSLDPAATALAAAALVAAFRFGVGPAVLLAGAAAAGLLLTFLIAAAP